LSGTNLSTTGRGRHNQEIVSNNGELAAELWRDIAMIVGAEVAQLCIGLYALFKGRMPTAKKSKYVVEGRPARVIGFIGLLPIPLSFLVGTAVGTWFLADGKLVTHESFFWVGTAIEGSIVALCFATIAVLARVYRSSVKQQFDDSSV
jgi:hypothetical protein